MTFHTLPSLGLLLLLGCPPGPPPVPPGPDASDASSPTVGDSAPTPPTANCGIACSNLADLGCSEGKATDCQVVMQHANDDRLIRSESGAPLSCACLAAAKDKVSARACGVHCP